MTNLIYRYFLSAVAAIFIATMLNAVLNKVGDLSKTATQINLAFGGKK